MNFILLLPKRFLLLLLLTLALNSVSGQSISETVVSPAIHKKRLNTFIIAGSTICVGIAGSLYFVWYKGYPQSNFHFFNDNKEWLQIDKFGHATTAYHFGLYCNDMLQWSGVNNTQSAIYSGIVGFLGLSMVEVMDGFSTAWGASSGDLIANFMGSSLFVSQQLIWKEQRISLKVSFHQTSYASYRPDLLGIDAIQQTIKDYNGHTFWLTANIHSFLPEESGFPKWLNMAVGYGADGMTGAMSNPTSYNGNPIPHFERVRQFYLSPDIDLRRIPTKNKTLKTVFKVISFIKIPLPTLEVDENGKLRFYPLYF
jgi:hypothetical protein